MSLFSDERGDTTTTLGFSLTWFVTFSVFLMNTQLGQLCQRRDAVDHAASLATDAAKKTYCQKEENAQATENEARRMIAPVIESAGNADDCSVSVRSAGEGQDPGATDLDVTLSCSFPCKIPLAAQAMCKDGKAKFEAKQRTTALGCDGKGS